MRALKFLFQSLLSVKCSATSCICLSRPILTTIQSGDVRRLTGDIGASVDCDGDRCMVLGVRG